MAEKELEQQFLEAGNKLLKVPVDVDELLALLDKVEGLLSKVEQSPIKSMRIALLPTMNALVFSEFLSHKDTNVKVSVAACLSEITRITAPDAPYSDDQMKQIFEVIVASFEMLGDNSCQSFEKRVSILETVAKVRSCVVMLDLECDELILHMFQYFLKAIRDFHTVNVFLSMETIMSLVLEESEEISPSLLFPLLTSVKKEAQDVYPIAKKLGEKVLANCTAKLKPYLIDAIKSVGMSPNDYSNIVASICQETSDTAEHHHDSVCGEHLTEERSFPEMMDSDKPLQVTQEPNPEAACPNEVGTVLEKSPKTVTSNGETQNVNDDLSIGVDSTKKEETFEPSSKVAEVEPVLSDPKISQPGTKPDNLVKKKHGRKPNALVQTPETSGQSKVEGDTEADLPFQGKNDSKEDDASPSEEPSVKRSSVLSGPEKVVEQVTLPTAPIDKPVKIASPSPTKNLPDGGRAKRGRPARVKKGLSKEDTDHGSPSVLKEALSSEHVESDALVSVDAVSKMGPEGEKETEEKPNEQLAEKGHSDKEKSDGATSDSEEKPLKRSGKKVDMKDKDEGSLEKEQGEKAKRGRPKSLPGKDLAGESSSKKMGSSLKPPEKMTSAKETLTTKSKRKRTPSKEETLENKDHGGDLVGSKIKVWWPDDKKFYEGVVESFDSSLNKHKVSYLDGDEEILLLKKERWMLVEGNTIAVKGQSTDFSSPDASSEMPQTKKAKTSSASGSKQAKTSTPLNKGKEISTSKSKVEVTKSSRRSKNDGSKAGDSTSKSSCTSKNDNISKSKGITPKSGTKSKVDTPRTGTKSKDVPPKTGTKSEEIPKAETKLEDDAAKTRTKSKKETPKTRTKSRANGTSKGKIGPSRAEETDTGEGKMLDSSKAHESETKSGKKRRR